MFSDDEPSVDETIFQDLRFTDGSVGRIKLRGSYPIVASDVPAALARGFRQRLTAADVDRLLAALNHCCRYYAESNMLPVVIASSGNVGNGGSAADRRRAGSLGDHQLVPQESFWNPVGHDDWVKLADGLSSYHRRGEACWLLARTVGNLPYHSPLMGVSKAGQDRIIAVDARLIRLGALRLAVGSFAASAATAACVELIALLVEMQGDQDCSGRYGRRIQKLFEASSARLWELAGPPLHSLGEADGPDLTQLPPFWTEASMTWLQEILHARKAGFLPGDALTLSMQKLFLDMPPPSGGALPAATNHCLGGTEDSGPQERQDQDKAQDDNQNELEGESKADGRRPREREDAPSTKTGGKDRAGTLDGAAGENSFTGAARRPATGKHGYDESVLDPSDPLGLKSEAAATLVEAIGELAAAEAIRKPDLKPFHDSAVRDDGFRFQPSMRPMEFLDLSPHGDETKRQFAEQFRVLTTAMPLTALLGYQELGDGLGDLRSAMPNFGPVIDALQGDFAFALRSERPASLRLRPMLILGPPAIGKTRFARELAKTLGAASSYISVAGDADNRRFAGTAHGFSTAHPSWPVERMARLVSANPILIVDEIEKAGGSKSNGTLADTILALLETESATQFTDPFLGGPIDLSMISWVFLANSREGLSEPLLSRLEIFQVEPPVPEAFDTIVQAIIADIARARKVEPGQMPMLPELFLAELRAAYAQRRDLRRVRITLEKALGILARYDNEHPGETLH